jgi:hypothetical protein
MRHKARHGRFVRSCRRKHNNAFSENASSVAPSTLAMSPQELSRICRLIIKPVDEWLTGKSAIIRAIHDCVAETALISGFRCMDSFVLCFEHHYPLLWDMFDRGYIKKLASLMFNSEFPELSALFSGLFDEFNYRFFGAKLPAYTVRVVRALADFYCEWEKQVVYEIDVSDCELTIQYLQKPEVMIARLLDLMARIHVGIYRDEAWREDLQRLTRLGAPTSHELARLQEAGWTRFSAAPWFPS